MKQSILMIIIILAAGLTRAQIAIGKDNVSNASVALEFGSGNRGLLLPLVEDKSGIAEEGTLIYDTSDHKVKYLSDGGSWINLSEDGGGAGTADISIQNGKTDQNTAKTGIGTITSTDGILVLEDDNKAMVLPKVASPHLNIINPEAGMLAYDTVKRQLAVYNGTAWTFWKP